MIDPAKTKATVEREWDGSILPQLVEYVRIPNKSPMFDADWEAHGYMEEAVQLMRRWAEAQPIDGMKVEVLRLPGRTPVLLVDIAGQVDDCVLMYGHLDKQPEFTGWSDGLEPWKPVLRDGKLYGRGGADDGRTTSRRWARASARRRWSCAWTPNAATTTSSGPRPRCAAT